MRALRRFPVGRRFTQSALLSLSLLAAVSLHPNTGASAAPGAQSPLAARVVAVGVTNPAGISPVGVFHPGSPIRDKPEFAAFTAPGRVLDPRRLLVTTGSNYGAPVASSGMPPGAVLSLDPSGPDPLIVPPDFASADGQAEALDGRVQVYTAQSGWFLNRTYNPNAVTGDLPAASAPLSISLNNAFGRPWITNAPFGMAQPGTESVTDPDGRPLAAAPSAVAGGVFAGDQTNRQPQLIPGSLTSGVVGTALLGRSPDGGGRAVFAAVGADGSLTQIHVELGVDGLAPAGTVLPLPESDALATRAGVAFNWVPDRILYVADPVGHRLAVVTLGDDGTLFQADDVRYVNAPELNAPVDVAPAVPEVANPAFSSNTTLAGGSDLYVANRGNGTIVRMTQEGTVVAVQSLDVPGLGVIGGGQLNGIAVSPDAGTIWVTLTAALPSNPDASGLVVALPAFAAPSAALEHRSGR